MSAAQPPSHGTPRCSSHLFERPQGPFIPCSRKELQVEARMFRGSSTPRARSSGHRRPATVLAGRSSPTASHRTRCAGSRPRPATEPGAPVVAVGVVDLVAGAQGDRTAPGHGLAHGPTLEVESCGTVVLEVVRTPGPRSEWRRRSRRPGRSAPRGSTGPRTGSRVGPRRVPGSRRVIRSPTSPRRSTTW